MKLKKRLLATMLTLMSFCTMLQPIALATGTGTENSPYVLTRGETKTVNASDYWLQATIDGATDFTISSSQGARIHIYKKTTFGKTEIYNGSSTNSLQKTISDCSINNGTNTYLIWINCGTSSSISCKVNIHADYNYYSNGSLWKTNNTSAMPYSTVYWKYWYASKDYIPYLVTYVSNANFLDYQSALANGTMTLVGVVGAVFGGVTSKALSTVSTIAGVTSSFDLKQDVLNKINTAGGYNSSTGTYSNGILLTESSTNSYWYYDVKTWNGGGMTGPVGQTGTWTNNT